MGRLRTILYYFTFAMYMVSFSVMCCLCVISHFMELIPFIPNVSYQIEKFVLINVHLINMFYLTTFGQRKIYIYGYDVNKQFDVCNNIIVVNHQCISDIHLVSTLSYFMNQLINTKPIFKNSLKYIPLVGAATVLEDGIDISRKNRERDLSYMKRCIKRIFDKNHKFSYILFPEGTRYNRHNLKKIESSNEFCKKIGLDPYPYSLTPRLAGLKILMQILHDKLDYIFDITVCIYDNIQKKHINGFAKYKEIFINNNIEFHVWLRPIPKDKIKNLNMDCNYLYEWFTLKNKFIEQFENDDYIHNLHMNLGIESRTQLSLPRITPFLSFISGPIVCVSLLCTLGFFKTLSLWVTLSLIGYMMIYLYSKELIK